MDEHNAEEEIKIVENVPLLQMLTESLRML
jgi:hypothetical protein